MGAASVICCATLASVELVAGTSRTLMTLRHTVCGRALDALPDVEADGSAHTATVAAAAARKTHFCRFCLRAVHTRDTRSHISAHARVLLDDGRTAVRCGVHPIAFATMLQLAASTVDHAALAEHIHASATLLLGHEFLFRLTRVPRGDLDGDREWEAGATVDGDSEHSTYRVDQVQSPNLSFMLSEFARIPV